MTAAGLSEVVADPLACWLASITWAAPIADKWYGMLAPGGEIMSKGADVFLPSGLGFALVIDGDDIAVTIPDHAIEAMDAISWRQCLATRRDRVPWLVASGRVGDGVLIRVWWPITLDLLAFLDEKEPDIKLGGQKVVYLKK